MTRADAIARLKAREAELRAAGIEELSLFGSTAREEAGPNSDIDLVARFADGALYRLGLRYVALVERLAGIVGARVDLVTEPIRKPHLQSEIDRDRVRVF